VAQEKPVEAPAPTAVEATIAEKPAEQEKSTKEVAEKKPEATEA